MTSPGGVSKTNLVISFDLGTTFSAASWVLVGNSQDPYVVDVSEYRENLPAKVPTVLYYDRQGELRAAGSETLDRRIAFDAFEQGWIRVEWFKLLLHLAPNLNNAPQTEIPRNKKLIHVIADFFRYMATLSANHFQKTMNVEGKLWEEVKDRVTYILSHPNGWNTFQHSILREAAHLAKLVPNSDEGNSRVVFVSEGEACLHWCVKRRSPIRDPEVGSNYIVVDAGAAAINISSFKTVTTAPPKFEESSIPECHLQGSAFVTVAFRKWVQDKLKGSSFGDPKIMDRMVQDFDVEVKPNFQDPRKDMAVKFGKPHDNDPSVGIEGGQLLVPGEEMARFFEPACTAIVNSVNGIIDRNSKTVVVLAGGFAGNSYLSGEVRRRLPGILVTGIYDATVKASAHGAIDFHLGRNVRARMARWTYGLPCVHDFNSKDPRHVQRKKRVQTNPVSGHQFIDGGFFVTLKKGTLVRETEPARFPFWHSQPDRKPTTLDICLESYQGNVSDIKFRDEDREEQFRELCWFQVTIPETALSQRVRKEQKRNKEPHSSARHYYVCNFCILVSFGPEFKFNIEWTDERGRTQRGSMTPMSNSVHVIELDSARYSVAPVNSPPVNSPPE